MQLQNDKGVSDQFMEELCALHTLLAWGEEQGTERLGLKLGGGVTGDGCGMSYSILNLN